MGRVKNNTILFFPQKPFFSLWFSSSVLSTRQGPIKKDNILLLFCRKIAEKAIFYTTRKVFKKSCENRRTKTRKIQTAPDRSGAV